MLKHRNICSLTIRQKKLQYVCTLIEMRKVTHENPSIHTSRRDPALIHIKRLLKRGSTQATKRKQRESYIS